jgi:hypothetical protein
MIHQVHVEGMLLFLSTIQLTEPTSKTTIFQAHFITKVEQLIKSVPNPHKISNPQN